MRCEIDGYCLMEEVSLLFSSLGREGGVQRLR